MTQRSSNIPRVVPHIKQLTFQEEGLTAAGKERSREWDQRKTDNPHSHPPPTYLARLLPKIVINTTTPRRKKGTRRQRLRYSGLRQTVSQHHPCEKSKSVTEFRKTNTIPERVSGGALVSELALEGQVSKDAMVSELSMEARKKGNCKWYIHGISMVHTSTYSSSELPMEAMVDRLLVISASFPH